MGTSRARILDADGQPFYLLWFALDETRRCMREGEPLPVWPWEATGAEVGAVGERLTRPGNLAALEAWGQGRESFNDCARGCTEEAIRVCRSRANGRAEPLPAPDEARDQMAWRAFDNRS
jgi:hypothetical protein